MYLLMAKRIVFPWVMLSACLLSIFLYSLAGSFTSANIAYAAEFSPNTVDNQQADPNPPPVSQGNSCEISTRFPDTITQWCPLITHYARSANLDPDLIAALIWQESGGNPSAYSHSGAVGLMQIMPRDGIAASFDCPNGPCFKDRPYTQELQNPEYNVQFGTQFLADLVARKGNLRDALKAYGPMDVGYSYADKVLNIYQTYGE
jgi:soluble lytic murein transglycosylase-like protein